jgi:hypothetical protein
MLFHGFQNVGFVVQTEDLLALQNVWIVHISILNAPTSRIRQRTAFNTHDMMHYRPIYYITERGLEDFFLVNGGTRSHGPHRWQLNRYSAIGPFGLQRKAVELRMRFCTWSGGRGALLKATSMERR